MIVMFLWILSACLGPHAFHTYSHSVEITALVLALVALFIFFSRWLNRQDLFAPWVAFPIAYIIWFSVGSINLVDDPDPPPYGLIALGLACYLLGVWIGKRGGKKFPGKLIPTAIDTRSPERLHLWLLIIGIASLLAYLWIAALMGIPGFGSEAAESRLKLLNFGKSQFIFLCGAWTLLILLPTRLWLGNQTLFGRFAIWFVILIGSIMVLSLGSRGNLLIPLATIFICRHYIFRSTKLRWAIPLGIALFVTASLFGWARDKMVTVGGIGNLDLTSTSFTSLYFYVHNTVTTLRDVVATIPRAVPYQYGYLSFGALASLLPGHHISSDMFFRQILGLEFIGFGQPATLLGPMYGDFGIWGVASQMFLVGMCYTRLYSWMVSRRSLFRIEVYAWVSQLVLFSLFGSLFTYFIDLAIPVGLIILHTYFLSESEQGRNTNSELAFLRG